MIHSNTTETKKLLYELYIIRFSFAKLRIPKVERVSQTLIGKNVISSFDTDKNISCEGRASDIELS
jgi:hypothetical protein